MNLSREEVKLYKQQYPAGTKIELIRMDDPYRKMPAGLKGIVTMVDDAGQIHCSWENGSGLALIPGVDSFRAVKEQEQSAGTMNKLNEMKTVLGDDYRFTQTKTVDEIKQIVKTGDMEGNDNVAVVLEAGNLDIELMIDFGEEVDGVETIPIHLEYFCCVRTNGEWESYREIDTAVNLDVPDLEAEMFRVLDKFAEEHGLGFFSENDIHQNRPPFQAEDEEEMEM